MIWEKHNTLILLTILISGWLTVIMQQFVPVAGGGMSLVFTLSVPLQVGLSIIYALIYRYLVKKSVTVVTLFWIQLFFISSLITLALAQYPYT